MVLSLCILSFNLWQRSAKNPYIHSKYEVANDIKKAELEIKFLRTIENICLMKKVIRTLQKTIFFHKMNKPVKYNVFRGLFSLPQNIFIFHVF